MPQQTISHVGWTLSMCLMEARTHRGLNSNTEPTESSLADIVRESLEIMCALFPGFNSLVGGIMGFSILISAEVFKHEPNVWYLDGTIGVLIGLIIFAYGVK